MSSKEQSVTLLRVNKRAQVAALRALGFNVSDNMKASEFPKYVRWAGGLLDVTIAATRKSDGAKLYYTKDEWTDLTGTERAGLLVRGVRVRADGLSFIISGERQNLQWSPRQKITDLPKFSGEAGLYGVRNSRERTEIISEFFNGVSTDGVVGAPAADFCMSYKAYTLEGDGLEDDTQWSLPCVCHAFVMYRYRNIINTVIGAAWDSTFEIGSAYHATCIEYDATSIWQFNPSNGYLSTDAKNVAKVVRPIAVE